MLCLQPGRPRLPGRLRLQVLLRGATPQQQPYHQLDPLQQRRKTQQQQGGQQLVTHLPRLAGSSQHGRPVVRHLLQQQQRGRRQCQQQRCQPCSLVQAAQMHLLLCRLLQLQPPQGVGQLSRPWWLLSACLMRWWKQHRHCRRQWRRYRQATELVS